MIFGTFPGTPAYPILHVGDVVTAVDGAATPTANSLTHTLAHYHSGQTVTLGGAQGRDGAGSAGAGRPSRAPWSTWADGRYGTFDLGIEPEDQVDFHYPFPVNINVTNIGGPSAGLAMTLGVIDALTTARSPEGTPWPPPAPSTAAGDVGRCGRRAPEDGGGRERRRHHLSGASAGVQGGASPRTGPGSRSTPVSTLDQALAVLAAHGGRHPGPRRPRPPLRQPPQDDGIGGPTVVGFRPCLRNAWMSITSSSHLAPDDVARHTFGTVRRGFDPNEVRAYLESIAIGLRASPNGSSSCSEDLADAEHRAANPVLDEATLTAAVGRRDGPGPPQRPRGGGRDGGQGEGGGRPAASERSRARGRRGPARTESLARQTGRGGQAAADDLRERTGQQVAAGLEAGRPTRPTS